MTQSDTNLALASGRSVPLTLWRPAGGGRHPLILFSHGANSRPQKYARLAAPLAEAGFLVAAPTHMDSPDHPGGGKIDPARSMALRMEDMRGLIAARTELGAAPGPIAAAGHSYGALIAQILIGARVAAAGTAPDPLDAAIDVALAFSPPGPFPPAISDETWKSVGKPMFVQTGTADTLPVMAPSWEVHRTSFDTTPASALLYVGDGVDHYFGNLIGRPERTDPPQTAELARAIALALDFLRRTRTSQPLSALAGPGVEMRVEVR
jgi:dienelactone hydrolase